MSSLACREPGCVFENHNAVAPPPAHRAPWRFSADQLYSDDRSLARSLTGTDSSTKTFHIMHDLFVARPEKVLSRHRESSAEISLVNVLVLVLSKLLSACNR